MSKSDKCDLLKSKLIKIRNQIDFIISHPYSSSLSSGNCGRGNKREGVTINQLLKRRSVINEKLH